MITQVRDVAPPPPYPHSPYGSSCGFRSDDSSLEKHEKLDQLAWRHVFSFMRPGHTAVLIAALAATLATAALRAVLPVLLGRIFDAIAKSGNGTRSGHETLHDMGHLCLALVGVGAGDWLANSCFLAFWVIFGELQAASVRDTLFHSILYRDMSWFDLQKEGMQSLVARIQTQTREHQASVSQALGLLVCEILSASASVGVAFSFSWKLTLVLFSSVPVSFAILSFADSSIQPAIKEQKAELAVASKFAAIAFTAIDLVKVSNSNQYELQRYSHAIASATRQYLIQARHNSFQIGYVNFWLIAMFVAGFAYGAALVNDGLAPGHVLTTFYAFMTALQGVEALTPHWLIFAKGKSAASYLRGLASDSEKEQLLRRRKSVLSPRHCIGSVELRNVSISLVDVVPLLADTRSDQVCFGYPSAHPVKALDGASLLFPAGQLTFLVGRSGSGKSTVGNVVSNLYRPQAGDVLIDDHRMQHLADNWIQNHVTLIQQSSVLFRDTLFANVAIGSHQPHLVSSQDVLKACISAMLYETVYDLPRGLSTFVGEGGHQLSGGQKQRLALARSWLRHTPILILDEITSGLDVSTTSAVMDSIRNGRQGKTTIIITHDLSQIRESDYVHVMDHGRVIASGFQQEIIRSKNNNLTSILSENFFKGGHEQAAVPHNFKSDTMSLTRKSDAYAHLVRASTAVTDQHPRLAPRAVSTNQRRRSITISTDQFCGATKTPCYLETNDQAASEVERETRCFSRFVTSRFSPLEETGAFDLGTYKHLPSFSSPKAFADETVLIDGLGHLCCSCTRSGAPQKSTSEIGLEHVEPIQQVPKQLRLSTIYKNVFLTLSARGKLTLILGLLSCSVGAASVPLFSYCFAKLLEVMWSTGDKFTEGQRWAVILVAIAIVYGLGSGLGRYLLEIVAATWVDDARRLVLKRVLRQPKTWFDETQHAPSRLVETLDCNAEEMRSIVGKFLPIMASVVMMLLISLLWALVLSWRLSLVALSTIPFVLGAVKSFTIISGRWEATCDKASEDASFTLTDILVNIRVIRAFSSETFFSARYLKKATQIYRVGLRRGIYTSWLYGLYQSISYGLTALIFYYGAVLITRAGDANLSQILEVVNLLLFGIGSSASLLCTVPQLVTAQTTATKVLGFTKLPSHEVGEVAPLRVTNILPVRMECPSFTYSAKGNQQPPIIQDLSLEVSLGQCVALVGNSGCGKSTILSLILGLYEPPSDCCDSKGFSLTFAGLPYSDLDEGLLRSRMAFVPQTPFIFPGTVTENILYGLAPDSPHRIDAKIRRAAQDAGAHDFIQSLPHGYGTIVGDGGQTLSGGQAQRLCIARALIRQPQLLILDEPTSALDAESSGVIRQTILLLKRKARYCKSGTSVILATHCREMMRTVDKIVVLEAGRKVQEGTFEDLWMVEGAFRSIMRAEKADITGQASLPPKSMIDYLQCT